jgi:hypothetical protein
MPAFLVVEHFDVVEELNATPATYSCSDVSMI